MTPLLPALALAQTGFQAYQGYTQGKRADELEARGPIDNVPAAYKAMLANQANQANNSQIAGYSQAIDNLNEQQSSTLGEAKRSGISSSNLLNVLTRLNQQGNKTRRDLAIAGQEAKQGRERLYNQGLLGQSQYQEQARQENQRAIGALRGAGNQNYYNAFTSGIGALGYGLNDKPTGFMNDFANNRGAANDVSETMDTMQPSVQTSALPERNPQMVPYNFGSNTDKPYFDLRKGLGQNYAGQPAQQFSTPDMQYPQGNATYLPQSYIDLYKNKFGTAPQF